MSEKFSAARHLRPSESAAIAHELCMALLDVLQQEGSQMSRRSYLIACGLAKAAEVFSGDVSKWFFSRMGEDQDLLDELQDRDMPKASNNEMGSG